MTTDTGHLTAIFRDIANDDVLVERQEETPSHEPMGEREAELEKTLSVSVRNDGLDEALDSGDPPSVATG